MKRISGIAVVLTAGLLLINSTSAIESPGETERVSDSGAATVKAVPQAKIAQISDKIDDLVAYQLQKNGQELNALSSDEVFLRRVYLDIAGRIPTIDETTKFLKSSSKTKRADLIDELLDSYGYVSRQFNFWADLLRIQSRLPGNLVGIPYIDYVKDSLENNVAYDDFVRGLINAEGPNLKRGNGAVGYYLRDRNMPEDNMSNTVRIFLGTRLECAQCHDHPFDKWTQRQYFEMVAFTGGISYRARENESVAREMRALYKDKDIPEKQKPLLNRLSQTVSYGVTGSGTGLARLPEGFLGDDGSEGDIVVGKTMFEGKPLVDVTIPKQRTNRTAKKRPNAQQAAIPGAKPVNSREAYANWLTDPENPRFATVIANRLWKQAMGLGLIEPIDIIEDDTVASNPELMDLLAQTIVDLDFDMKQFLRAIYNSRTYQAAAHGEDIADPQKFYFNGPVVRRMSAEQIWDSLLVLTVPDTDERFFPSESRYAALGNDPYAAYEKLVSMNASEVKDLVASLADQSKAKRPSYKDDPAYKKMMAERAQLNRQLQQARKQKNVDLERDLRVKIAALTAEFRKTGRQAATFVRASELPSPAPTGHFLREFGQSDREQIENSNTDPAVTQVLSMMNGYIEEKISKDAGSVLMQTALKATSAKECTELIFLSMLNREPTSKERRAWERDFKDAVKEGTAKVKEVYADLIWTLANSNEFIFVK